VSRLKAGDRVLISGTIYTARDSAHQRLIQTIVNNEEMPLSLKGQIIYYVGPCPAKPGQVIGSAGPTTSGRVDVYTPLLLDKGLKGMIGKGNRSQEVVSSIQRNKAVYFAATGGIGALLAKTIKSAQVIAYEDLGPEAIYCLEVEDFPVIVAIDCRGNNLYEEGKRKYKNFMVTCKEEFKCKE
jgi:fumarate hydratase subunit beta